MTRTRLHLLRTARSAWFTGAALTLALFVAAFHYLGWAWTHRPIELPEWEGKVRGFAYSGFRAGQDPTKGVFPTQEELAADMAQLAGLTNRIRTYTSIENGTVPALAREHNLRVTAGAWLDKREDNNLRELTALAKAVRENRNIDQAMIGNEAMLRGDLSVDQMIGYLKHARKAMKVPVSTAEPWHIWLKHPELVKHVDFITVHLLPFWEGVPVDNAVEHVLMRYQELREAYPTKKIVIGEVGWPSRGDRFEGAEASPAAQARFVREFLDRTRDMKLDYFFMEAFDQPWKDIGEGRTGAYWGLYKVDRTAKFPLDEPVVTDPTWPTKALAATLLAAPFIFWFAVRFRRFKPMGKLFFAALIQASAALIVWLVTLPFEFYLSPVDWIALAVLLPALVAMTGILLVNGFEFTEVAWRRRWQREFRPATPVATHMEPFVSIHLPCYNEPPEMVKLTLASLARLDYENFEVIVIDNNTKDEAVWKPVEEYVATLGPKFRFFHLPKWPGFKAGALNFALTATDPRAEVIGVVDADYEVDRDWLSRLAPHFLANPKVAVVQSPQAHRDYQHHFFRRMANWEFDGFFRIGMHHRNERNAIIQHGTMTLVRRTALESTGSWSEWCICEDAELGLRLMHAGYETRYVDHVFGRGLTPADFKAFKSQRFRWAFGAMQILKGRWGWLVAPGPLSGGQRFHFLTGWASWFSDALHLVFTMASIVWTIGILAAPGVFSLPLDLFMIPVLAFFVAKAAFGPALYRMRVPCSWADVFGASLASMGLSHAIARGVFQGVFEEKGVFVRTTRTRAPGTRLAAAFAVIREESLMLVALVLAASGVAWRLGTDHREALLWAALLSVQALPYLATVVSMFISELGERAPVKSEAPKPAPARPRASPAAAAHLPIGLAPSPAARAD
jgi:exo-beta-1,3-glucanase (GH17 family)/cellulose synthase/poly-beta-1,6-N-acetylglucosamine synthase-like glycosyltransferase